MSEDGLSKTDDGAYVGWAHYLVGVASDTPPEDTTSGSAGMGHSLSGSGSGGQGGSQGGREPIRVTWERKKPRTTQDDAASLAPIDNNTATQVEDAELTEIIHTYPLMFRMEVQVLMFEGSKMYLSGKPFKEEKPAVQACHWVRSLSNTDFTDRGLPVRPGMDLRNKSYSIHVHYVEDPHTLVWHGSPVFLAAVSTITGLEPDPTVSLCTSFTLVSLGRVSDLVIVGL